MLAKEKDEESDAAFEAYWDWLCNRDMAPIGGGSGGGGTSSTWLNTYLNAVHSTFQNGYNITTSQFNYEYNLQINSPSYNGTITFQTGMMDYYTFWSIDGRKTWHQGNYINSEPIYTTINVPSGDGGYDDIPLNPAIGMGERIVGIANGYVGSTDYNLLSRKDDFLRGNPKCNKFVYDVLLKAGASPGLPNQPGRWGLPGPKPPIASQWANTNYSIPGWVVVNSPFPGDVASFNGHVGIVIGNGLTISATLYDGVVRNDWGFRSGQTPVFRRFVGYSPYY